MFELSEIKQLIELVDQSSIEEFEIENEGARLYISKPKAQPVAAVSPVQVQVPQVSQPVSPAQQTLAAQPEAGGEAVTSGAKAEEDGLHEITSPMVGTFYSAPSPGAEPYVKKGDKVQENTVVCIVEAMKLMNEIEAEVKGEIVEVLVENAELVEFGQPLFRVKPD